LDCGTIKLSCFKTGFGKKLKSIVCKFSFTKTGAVPVYQMGEVTIHCPSACLISAK
jgi:hypothetical protein